MKSRTSFFEKTLFRKNLTRFAPLWGIYLLCLLIGLGLMYMDGDRGLVNFWFANNMAGCIGMMGLVNLFYAPIVAALLFGDLFNSRMCNALHAMPMRRETMFVTNVVSGLMFSVGPTAVMALLSLPLLAGTVVHNAWLIGVLWFIGTNLEFICFFGMAVFCIFCTGNRLGFAALYAVLNGGAYLLYGIVDMLYTPMLYGVVTPFRLAEILTPIANILDDTFVEIGSYHDLVTLFKGRMDQAVTNFWVTENFYTLIVLALVGIVFTVLGLLMYRKRHLECAGDAVAVRWLAPVFQTIAAVAGLAAGVIFLEMFFGYNLREREIVKYGLAVCGMAVGWFAGRMILDRSTRVFRMKNWIGLGVMAAVFVVSLTLTHFDVFGIETWIPKAEKVASVTVNCSGDVKLTEKEDIAQIIRLQEMALEDRLEQSDSYPASYVDSFGTRSNIPYPETGFSYGEDGDYDTNEPHYFADWITIEYQMESGKEITRHYTVWASFEEGEIIKEYASRWESVWAYAHRGYEEAPNLNRIHDFIIDGQRVPEALMTAETVQSFLDAVRADCDERTMMQDSYYHDGRFKVPVEDDEVGFVYDRSMYVDISAYVGNSQDLASIFLQVYADSAHTIAWLQEHGLLRYEIVEGNFMG